MVKLEQLSHIEIENLKGRNIVGADPGKFNLVYMVDSHGKRLRYTALQRRTESMHKRNERILLNNKNSAGITERRFQVVGVNEFRTSKLCCQCHGELSHLKVKHGDDGEKSL